MNFRKILAAFTAIAASASVCVPAAVFAEDTEAAPSTALTAYLDFTNSGWWPAFHNDPENDTMKGTVAEITGDGSYTVSLSAAELGEDAIKEKIKGAEFMAIYIPGAENVYPNLVITVDRITADDKEIPMIKKNFTNCELEKKEADRTYTTRTNIYNQWASGYTDDARCVDGLVSELPNADDYDVQIIDPDELEMWTNLTVEFTISGMGSGTSEEPTETETTETTETTENPSVDYETIYSKYVYDTLIPEKGKAARDTVIGEDYNLNELLGVVSTAIYDFDKDGKKELLAVTRESTSNPYEGDSDSFWTGFYLNLYQADEDGKVSQLDRVSVADDYEVNPYFLNSDSYGRYDEMDMMISGNAVYVTSCNHHEVGHYEEYTVFDVTGGKFSKYGVLIDSVVGEMGTFDISAINNRIPSEGQALYINPDDEWSGDIPASSYATSEELNDAVNTEFKNHHLEFNSVEVGTESMNVDVVPAVNLMSYVLEDTEPDSDSGFYTKKQQSLSAAMITHADGTEEEEPTEKKSTTSTTKATTSKSTTTVKTTTTTAKSGSVSTTGATTATGTASPNTGDAGLPMVAGAAAAAAMALLVTKKKND